jgi:hypothetical protein
VPDDFIIRTGDMLQVTIPPPAVVPMLMAPGPLMGTSTSTKVMGQFVCLLGDEIPMAWRAPLPYTAPPFVTPGVGTLKVILLPTNQTVQTKNGKVMLIKGGTFQALFQVTAPAMQPTPAGPVPDPLAVKNGTAQFITMNATVKAG